MDEKSGGKSIREFFLFVLRLEMNVLLRCTCEAELISKESKIPFRFFAERFGGCPALSSFGG